ncbi:MAG: PEGA domain-containing protein [Minicystis sp.]
MSRAALRRLFAAALAATMLAVTSAAPAGEAADKAAAAKLLREGNQLLGDGDYVAALDKFRAAYARYPSAKILLNIGTTLRQLGRNIEAAETYEAYLKDPKAEPAKVAGLQRILQEIEAIIARVRIEVNEPGATVRLDSKEIRDFKSGMEIRVEAGDHTIIAERSGFPPAVETFKLAPHEQRTVTLRLRPPEKVVVAVSGPQRTISYVIGGIGAGGLITGGVAGIVAITKNQAAKSHCVMTTICDQQGVDLGKSAKTSALVSTVSLAIGAGALVTGVVLYFTAPKTPRTEPAPKVGFTVDNGGPFLTVEGAF